MQQANLQSKVAYSTYVNGMIKVTNCVEFKPPSHVTTSLPINGLCHPRHGESFRYHQLSTGGHTSLGFCSAAIGARTNNTDLLEGNGSRHHHPTQTSILQPLDLILPPPPHGQASTFPNCSKSDALGRLPSAPSQSLSSLLQPIGPLATSSLPSQQQPTVVHTCGSPATSVTYSSMCRPAEPGTRYRGYPAVIVHHRNPQQHHIRNHHHPSQSLVNDHRPPPRHPNQAQLFAHTHNRYCSHLPEPATAPSAMLEVTAQSLSGREYALTQESISCTALAVVHTPESCASRPAVAAAAANTCSAALSSRAGHVKPTSGLVTADSTGLQPPPGGGPSSTQDPVSRIASTTSLASTANATAAQPSSSTHLFRSDCKPACSISSGEAVAVVVEPPVAGHPRGRVLMPHYNMRHANVLRYPKYTNRKNSGFERRLKHTGLILDAKVTLRLLRRMLQPFINRAVNNVLQHYMEEYINLAVCNIRDNLGQQAVTENDLVKVRQHIMQRVALQYFPKEERENRIRLVRAVQQRIISNQRQNPQQPSQSLHIDRRPRRTPTGGNSTGDHLRRGLLTGNNDAFGNSMPDYSFAEEFTGTPDTPQPRTCTPGSEAASGSTSGSFQPTSSPSPQSTTFCQEVPVDSGRQRRPPPPLSIPSLAEDPLRPAPDTEREGLPANTWPSPPLSSASSCCTVGLFFCDLSSLDGEAGDEGAAVASTSGESGQHDPVRCQPNSRSSASAVCDTRCPTTALTADRIHTSVSHATLSPWRRRRLSRSTMKRKHSNANAAGVGWSTQSWSTSVGLGATGTAKRNLRGVKSSPDKKATGLVRHLSAVGKTRRRRRLLSPSDTTPVTDTPWDQVGTNTRELDDLVDSGDPDGVVGETDNHSAPDMFRLDPRTVFTLGSSANAWLGLGAARGRIYTKHPELFRYACDSEDKAWLVRRKVLHSHGVKAYLMLSGQVRNLARQLSLHQEHHPRVRHDEGADAGGDVETGHRVSDGDELETFTLPLWLLHKVQTAAANHHYFSQCPTSSTDDSNRATPVPQPKATWQTLPPSRPPVTVSPASKMTVMGRNSLVCLSPNVCIGTSSGENDLSGSAPVDQRTTDCTTSSSTADAVTVGAGPWDVVSTSPKPPTLLRFDLS